MKTSDFMKISDQDMAKIKGGVLTDSGSGSYAGTANGIGTP